MIELTPEAAREVQKIMDEEENETVLSVMVIGGGCNGFEYDLGLKVLDGSEEGVQLESHGIPLIVDHYSLALMEGATIDYSGGFNGKGFVVNNPLATGSCGCGKSFNVESGCQ